MPRAAFRLDAGAALGVGHLARASVLAGALAERGWTTTLYGQRETASLAASFPAFTEAVALEDARGADATAIPAAHDLAVIDHYGLDAAYESALRRRVGALLAFSDFPDRDHDCDGLVDANLGRHAADYAGHVPHGCTVMAGSSFVLLHSVYRAPFRSVRDARCRARNVLLTFGGGDPADATSAALATLRAHAPVEWRIRAVLGPAYPRKDAIAALARDWPSLDVEVAPADLRAAFAWADVAVTASGGTCWELCHAGVPFAVVTGGAVENTNARRLAERGCALDLGTVASLGDRRFVEGLDALMQDAVARQQMAEAARALIDGRGAERICDWIEALPCAY